MLLDTALTFQHPDPVACEVLWKTDLVQVLESVQKQGSRRCSLSAASMRVDEQLAVRSGKSLAISA